MFTSLHFRTLIEQSNLLICIRKVIVTRLWKNSPDFYFSKYRLVRTVNAPLHSYFYMNTLYKNIEAQIVPKNKNKLRTS